MIELRRNYGLEYYIHDEPDAFRFELSGSLSGDGAQDVYHAWRTALSIIGDRPLVVDLTLITEADEPGRALLVLWHRQGARIIAASTKSRAFASSILGQSFPEPPARLGLLQRLRAFVRGRAAVAAAIPAGAEPGNGASASAPDKSPEFAAVSDGRRLECRVR